MATKVTRYHMALALAKARAFVRETPLTAEGTGIDVLLWWADESRQVLDHALRDLRETTDTDTGTTVAIKLLLATYPGPGPGGRETL